MGSGEAGKAGSRDCLFQLGNASRGHLTLCILDVHLLALIMTVSLK